MKSKRDKQILRKITTGPSVKRYRIKHYLPRCVVKSRHSKRVSFCTRKVKLTKAMANQAKELVKDFLEDDAHSRMAAGKNEYITRQKVKTEKIFER